MKLNVRYEKEFQTLEVSVDELWVSLSLEEFSVDSIEEKEKIIQEEFDKQFNRPDYNNWHKFDRHRGNLKRQFRKDDENPDESDGLDNVSDNSQEQERNRNYEYEDLCDKLRQALKPEYAEALIAVVLDEKTPEEYAAEINIGKEAMYKRLQRAKKKCREIF